MSDIQSPPSRPSLIDRRNSPGQEPPLIEPLKHIAKHLITKSRIFVTNLGRTPGVLKVDELIIKRYLLEGINDVIKDIVKGNVRCNAIMF